MKKEKMSEMKDSFGKKNELFKRLMKHFDDAGHVVYKRVDIQMNPDKQYFLAVCLGNFLNPSSTKVKAGYGYHDRDDITQVLYFSTANANKGVKSEDDLPGKWLEMFVYQNAEYAKKYNDNYPAILKELVSSTVSELAIKMGIAGV